MIFRGAIDVLCVCLVSWSAPCFPGLEDVFGLLRILQVIVTLNSERAVITVLNTATKMVSAVRTHVAEVSWAEF